MWEWPIETLGENGETGERGSKQMLLAFMSKLTYQVQVLVTYFAQAGMIGGSFAIPSLDNASSDWQNLIP